MKVAIYARYSTEKQNETSIDGQFRTCEEYAKRQGWKIVRRFSDEAISGAKTDRPGYQALLAAAEAHEFDIILAEEVSRLWRDQAEQWRAVKRLEYLERHVVAVNDGVDTRREGFSLLLSVRGAMNAEARREIALRTRRGLRERAINGFCAGGASYGYRSTKNEHGATREIVPEQAKTIVLIFERFADGQSTKAIAAQLNEMGVPAPRGKKWLSSAIYGHKEKGTGILNNPLYIGRQVWNRSKWVMNPTTEKRERRDLPESEWVITEIPLLRIVPQPLWDRVKARQQEQHRRSINIRTGLSKIARAPRYLFSSLLRCGVCGGKMVIYGVDRYACSSHANGGRHACANRLNVKRPFLEYTLLKAIRCELFEPECLEEFRDEAARLLREARAAKQPDQSATRAELAKVERELENLMTAIKAGIITETTKAELEKLEARKRALLASQHVKAAARDDIPEVLPNVAERFHKLIHKLEVARPGDIERARMALRKLVGDIIVEPSDDGTHLRAKIEGDYAGLFELLDGKSLKDKGYIRMVAGTGFEPMTFGL